MDQGQLLTFPAVPCKTGSVEIGNHSRILLDLYDREQTPLKRYVAMLGIDAETARDIVQEGFLKLHEHLLAGGDQANLRAWLYRVVDNNAPTGKLLLEFGTPAALMICRLPRIRWPGSNRRKKKCLVKSAKVVCAKRWIS